MRHTNDRILLVSRIIMEIGVRFEIRFQMRCLNFFQLKTGLASKVAFFKQTKDLLLMETKVFHC